MVVNVNSSIEAQWGGTLSLTYTLILRDGDNELGTKHPATATSQGGDQRYTVAPFPVCR